RVHERSVLLIDPELIRRAVVRHVDVDPAVAVEVSGGDPERGAVFGGQARFGGDVSESAVPVVVEQMAWFGTVDVGRTVIGQAGDAVTADVRRHAVAHVMTD